MKRPDARTALGHGHKTSNCKRHYKLKNISVNTQLVHTHDTKNDANMYSNSIRISLDLYMCMYMECK